MMTADAPPVFDGLPDLPAIRELRERPQWVAWTWRIVDGRPTKPPINPHTGLGASHSQPAQWGTYEEAEARAMRGRLAGVGYVMTSDDGLTGADLDKCRNPETGELEDWAAEIVAFAETYTEVSPSGTGLRLIWRGKVEKSAKADPVHVEVYRDKRYLTITGNHVAGTPVAIGEAPRTASALAARLATYQRERERAEDTPAPGRSTVQVLPRGGSSPFFRNVNTAALSGLASWVPALFGAAAKHQPTTGAYRISSRALGRDLQEDLSIAPNGIVDFGVHDMGDSRDGKRSAVTIAMEFGGHATAKEAAFWLCARLGTDPGVFGWEEPGRGGDAAHGAAIAAALIARPLTRHADGTVTDEDGVVVEEEAPAIAGPVPADLTIGGLGSALAGLVRDTARLPSGEFAFLPAMALLAAIFGRRFVTPTGAPLNLYLVGIGVSGSGKDHALNVVRTLPHDANIPFLLGPSDVSSDSAIEKAIRRNPCCVLPLDEIGIFLQGVSNKNSGGHERRVRKVLLELYSLGRSNWSGKETADTKRDISPIWCPTLSVMGFSTPSELFDGLEERNLKDGFLARLIFLGLDARPDRNPSAKGFETPREVVAMIKQAMAWMPGGNLAAMRSANMRPPMVTVPYADAEAGAAFESFVDWQNAVIDADETVAGYVNRAAENALRLATLRALSREVVAGNVAADLGRARVGVEDIEWAAAIIQQSLSTLDVGIKAFMAGSDFERAHKIAYAAIAGKGRAGVAESLLRQAKGISKLDQRTYQQVIEYLATAQLIRIEEPKGRGRPGRRFYPLIQEAE